MIILYLILKFIFTTSKFYYYCGKEKKDFEVWSNKLVIGITFDSDFQNNDIISNMSDKSIICHQCIVDIQNKVKDNLDCK